MDLNKMMQKEDERSLYEKEYKDVLDKYWVIRDLIDAYDKESDLDEKSIENVLNIINDFSQFFKEKGFELVEEKADFYTDFKINISAKYKELIFELSIPRNSKGRFDFYKIYGESKEKVFSDIRVMPIRNFNISIDEDIDIKYAKDVNELIQLREKLELNLKEFKSLKNSSEIKYVFKVYAMFKESTEFKPYNRFLDLLKDLFA